MFFKPKTVASMVAAMPEEFDLYSDYHKDAIGCRPRTPQPTSPVERAVEIARLGEWMAEGERIKQLRIEVAKFDFSRGMEYLKRREGLGDKEAFQRTLQEHSTRPYPNDSTPNWDDIMDTAGSYGWDFVAMDAGMPQQLGPDLKAMWEELK